MGSVVISIDAELGWGFHDRRELPVERIRTARRNWRRLSSLFDEYEIPVTWAIVGHLFCEKCERTHTDHPAGTRCCSSAAGDVPAEKVWFGDGVVEAVRDADVAHEIAGHGFTHVHFEHGRMYREFAASEVRSCLAAASERGLTLDSFVFPVNRVGYRDLLADHGITCYRGETPSRRNRRQKLLDVVRNRGRPPTVVPEVDEYGLVNVPASMNLFGFEGWARSLVQPIRGDPITNRIQRGIDALAERDGVLHLWFHPHDLTHRRDFERFRSVLDAIARGRDHASIRVETMGDVAARVTDADERSADQ